MPTLRLSMSHDAYLLVSMSHDAIHFGQLLLESTLVSYGHDLWKKYNVLSVSCTIQTSLYFPLSINAFPHWILIGS